MNLGVNLSVTRGCVSGLAAMSVGVSENLSRYLFWAIEHRAQAMALTVLAGLALTAVTQYAVWRKSFGGPSASGKERPGGGRTLSWRRPGLRKSLPALAPVLAGLFWLPAVWRALSPRMPGVLYSQETFFALWLVVLGALAALPLLKKGLRRYIPPAWLLTAACWMMLGLRQYPCMWSEVSRGLIPYQAAAVSGTGIRYIPVGWGSWATALFAGIAAGIWLAFAGLTLVRKTPAAESEEDPLYEA